MFAHVNTYINLQYLKNILYGIFGTKIDLSVLPIISSIQSVKVLNRVVCIHMYKLKKFCLNTNKSIPILFEHKEVNSNSVWTQRSQFQFCLNTKKSIPILFEHKEVNSNSVWTQTSQFQFCLNTNKSIPILFEHKQVNSNPLTSRGILKDINWTNLIFLAFRLLKKEVHTIYFRKIRRRRTTLNPKTQVPEYYSNRF
jgi:hypothetical protein